MKLQFKRVSWLTILISANVALFLMSAYACWTIFRYQPPQPTLLDALLRRPSEPQIIDYKDFLSIMLTGLSAMITALGIGLATIAIWGYGQIKEEAKRAAQEIARLQTVQASVALGRERQSVADARAQLEKIHSVPPEMVQNLVDALVNENENGTKRASRSPVEKPDAPSR